MLITSNTSTEIEQTIMKTHINCAKHVAARGGGSDVISVGSGSAHFLGRDSFLSQVVAWGFHADSKELVEQLEIIENFYRKNSHTQIDIELSPLCGSYAATLLSDAGYKANEFNNISIHPLTDLNIDTNTFNSFVKITKLSEFDEWASTIATGFDCIAAKQQFLDYVMSENTTAFHILQDNHVVAGGTIAIHNGIADLGVTSTLPTHRGQGMQKYLLQARLNFAKENNVRYAIVTTEPGSISDANIIKMGFKRAYTRVKFTKEIS